MLTQKLIEMFPEKCDPMHLQAVMLVNMESMKEIFGKSTTENLITIMGKDLVVVPKEGHKLLLFAHEGVRVNKESGKSICNPREVILSLYKAIEMVKMGIASGKTCSDAETFAVKRMCLVLTAETLFPAYHWYSSNDELKEKEIAKSLIKKGRQLMEAVISEDEDFDWA